MHVSFYPVDLPLMPVMKWVSGAHVQLKLPFFDACDVTTLLGSSQCVRKLEDSSLPPSLPVSLSGGSRVWLHSAQMSLWELCSDLQKKY